jgi:bacteriocin-like protein
MKSDFIHLSDEELSNVTGGYVDGSGIQITTPGNSNDLGSGVLLVANQFANAKYTGIANGTAPMFSSGDPVAFTIIP